MNMNDLRPASFYARRSGCKLLVHGQPGSGKTPIFATAPRPLLLACEPGLMSMRNVHNVATYYAPTPKLIDDFFLWFFGSNDRKNFDTLGVDSASYMANIYLQSELGGQSKGGNKVHGEAAYGNMLRNVMKHMRPLFFLEQMHTYIICHQGVRADGMLVPGFPGRALEKELPHECADVIVHLGIKNVGGTVGQTTAFQTFQSFDVMARDRSSRLDPFEPPNLARLFTKAMS